MDASAHTVACSCVSGRPLQIASLANRYSPALFCPPQPQQSNARRNSKSGRGIHDLLRFCCLSFFAGASPSGLSRLPPDPARHAHTPKETAELSRTKERTRTFQPSPQSRSRRRSHSSRSSEGKGRADRPSFLVLRVDPLSHRPSLLPCPYAPLDAPLLPFSSSTFLHYSGQDSLRRCHTRSPSRAGRGRCRRSVNRARRLTTPSR